MHTYGSTFVVRIHNFVIFINGLEAIEATGLLVNFLEALIVHKEKEDLRIERSDTFTRKADPE